MATLSEKKTGLFFGSFNPIHIGHLIIANHIVQNSDLDDIWFVISPQSPFKKKASLLADYHRYALVDYAVEDNNKLWASNIEFKLPQPSYTIHSLAFLEEKYPMKEFALIMGEDNIIHIDKWKNGNYILDNYPIYVYPRPNIKKSKFHNHKNITIIKDVPLMEISSSFIRNSIKEGKDVRYLLSNKVWQYIEEMRFYK
ncbi:MAG: nicotinate-nucleotide adenylyltransferase [Bacteroidales bacterium]|nr:nicotinate-nucleotide adenylyltransferase [Bacteroidales bacterium]